MLREEALDVLGLSSGATAAQIKESYRDLVKVWHPDRFGSDPRLSQKAEEKLQQINDAYRVLMDPSKSDSTGPNAVRRPAGTSTAPNQKSARLNRSTVGWVGGGLGIAAAILATLFALSHRATQTQVSAIPATSTKGSSGVESHIEPSPEPVPPKNASSPNHVAAQLRVRQLSDAEAERLESACPKENEMQDPTGYQKCVQSQLRALSPDLSELSASDRAGIESACRRTKIQEGSAAYNRCLTRMVKLLNESSGP